MKKRTSKPKDQNESQSLIPNDILYKIIERLSTFRVWLYSLVIYSVLEITIGFVMDYLYPGQNFISIQNKAEFIPSINAYVILMPVIWAMCRWLPARSFNVVKDLENKGLIATENRNVKDFLRLSQHLHQAFARKLIYILAIVGTIIVSVIFFGYSIPIQNKLIGMQPFWIYKPVPYVIYVLLFALSCYVLFLMLFRQIITIMVIARFFNQSECINKILPLHPDGCGGFAELGKLSTSMVLVVVLFLIWSLVQAYFPILIGGRPLWTTILLIYCGYFVVVPILLLVPVWFPHRAMVKYKHNKLEILSQEFMKFMDQSIQSLKNDDIKDFNLVVDHIKKLQEVFTSLVNQLPTWPIAFKRLQSMGITTAIPFLISVSISIFDFIKTVNPIPLSGK